MVCTTRSTAHLASVTKVRPLGLGAYIVVPINRNNWQCNPETDSKHEIIKSLLNVIILGFLHIQEW
jgi:hypothetical protein